MRLVRPSTPVGTAIQGPTSDPYPGYLVGTTYALGARVISNTGPAATNIYESLQAGNTGHAVTDPLWWAFVSVDNPYRMFDQVANSQTTASGSIAVSFFATPLANTVALLNVFGTSATVTVTIGGSGGIMFPPDGTVVYSRTQTLLVPGASVSDWYSYFFGDMGRRTDVIFADLPSYSNQVITVTLNEPGGIAAIGTLAVGLGVFLGDTLAGAKIGINDYSRKLADDFGNFSIVERAFSKRGSFTLVIPNERVDEIANLLPLYRAKPMIWLGDDNYGSTFIYGFYKSYDVTIQYEHHSVVTIEIEGLS